MTNTPKKITSLLACCVFALTTLQARVSFNPNTDILIAQFDGRPDADDIHSQAALGSMLLHPDFAGVEVYAVMGAVGTQGGTFIDSTNLFNQIYGPEGTDTWTDAHADWTTSVTRIKNKARAVLDAGGHVWVQEAGQSDITADWVQGLIDDGVSETLIKSNVTVVQHSNWNEDKTTDADLEFVQNTTDYVKIADGNSGGNGTPDYHLDDTAFMNEIFAGEAPPKTEALWLLADQIIKDSGFNPSWSSIPDGGVDFSDEVETWWIFELGTHADTVRKFWDWYVVDPAVEAFVEQNGIVAFETESVNPTTPEWQEATLIAGFSGDSYFIAQEENLNQGGEGVVSYPVYITTTGRYQLNWRSRIGIGSDNTEHNDNFARVVDADGNPVTPVVNDNDATGTWYKAYMNRANAWDWQTSNKDNDPHSLSWNLQADTLYYFQISARSNGHAVDRVALWDHNRHNLANKTTGKNPNNGDFDNLINSATSVVGGLKKIAYIHGDIAADGTVPSGPDDPFHQMLLTDTGRRGLSIFKAMVEAEGHTIEQFYDQDTTLDAAFLDQFDAIIFSLHQKIWSSAEKAALNTWLQAGGGMLIYSDSASGGLFSIVGAQNTVGQTVTNNLISQYGMEVTVDQADGVKAIQAGPGATHPIVFDRPVLEGEGVSPVAVDPTSQAVRLIPYKNNPDFVVSGTPTINKTQNITIQNPQYAALALAPVGDGNIIAMFDRQPMWNNGEGSDIEERDNEEILRRIVNFLVGVEALNSPPTV
ncbi:MAG: hypothetical protein GVY36_12515, partial [Verrucomicrobia bacterium]|nr:hypothetical protein [Verrucomicrobiota bacterium]